MTAGRGTFATGWSRRAAGACFVVCLLAAFSAVSVAGAEPDTETKLAQAKKQLDRIEARIEAQRARLDELRQELAVLAGKLEEANDELEGTTSQIFATRDALQGTRVRLEELHTRLDERARQAYIQGPGGGLAFLLDATSMADLTDRIEFVDALSQQDADLVAEIEVRQAELEFQESNLENLRRTEIQILNELEADQAELYAKFEEQEAIQASLLADANKIEDLVDKYRKQLEKERREAARLARLAALAASGAYLPGLAGDGPLFTCPVGGPTAYSDTFGAPRSGGRTHAGVDMFAAYGTPVVATFNGVASSASNSLGGLAAYVHGAEGYTYNAHLSSFGNLGSVQTGDIIGYVGTSGNAQGTSPHLHFEWHPGNGGAVNPTPYVDEVCR